MRDILYPTGRIREELTLRAEITKFNKTRTVPVSSPKLHAALDAYLDYRVREGMGVAPGANEFRSVAPDMPLILSGRGTGFSLIRKNRKLVSGEIEEYLACDPLENCFRRLYRSAGLFGASSHSGRRFYASMLMRDGVDIETISYLLGHESIYRSAMNVIRRPGMPCKEPVRAFILSLT